MTSSLNSHIFFSQQQELAVYLGLSNATLSLAPGQQSTLRGDGVFAGQPEVRDRKRLRLLGFWWSLFLSAVEHPYDNCIAATSPLDRNAEWMTVTSPRAG
jgi:hypothetical protein